MYITSSCLTLLSLSDIFGLITLEIQLFLDNLEACSWWPSKEEFVEGTRRVVKVWCPPIRSEEGLSCVDCLDPCKKNI